MFIDFKAVLGSIDRTGLLKAIEEFHALKKL
jgi:hypothetical protein